MLPSAMLTSSIRTSPCASSVSLDRHSGKGSASAAAQRISVIWVPSSGSVSGSVPSKARTSVRRTAWRWAGSASAASPVSGPSTSRNTSTSPAARSGQWPASVARVAPLARQQRSSPQVWKVKSLWSCAQGRLVHRLEGHRARLPRRPLVLAVGGDARRERRHAGQEADVVGQRERPALDLARCSQARALQPSCMA